MKTDLRLVLPATFGAVAVGVAIGFPEALNSLSVVAWTIVGAVITVAFLVRKWQGVLSTVAVTGAVAALLLTSAAAQTSARNPTALVDAASANRFVTVTALTDAERPYNSASRHLPVTITAATIGNTTLRGLRIPAILFGSTPTSGIGAYVEVSGNLVRTQAGDRAAYLIFARGDAKLIEPPPWYLDWSNQLRAGFRAAALKLPGDGGALLPGLSIGDTRAVSPALDEAMKATSLSHLTAVSGANCAVVVGLIMLLGRAMGLSRGVRIAFALSVLTGFVVLVTPDASVLRAAVMASVVLIAMARGRGSKGLPVLSLAIILLLGFDPWLSRDYGFILSVLATAGLLVLAGPIAGVLARWLPDSLAILVSIPLAAQLACQPVLILLNPAIPVYGVIANLLAEPAAPIATVIGLLACVCLTFVPPVGAILVSIAWLPSAWIAAIAHFFATAPGPQAPWFPGILGTVLLSLVTGLLLIVGLRKRSRTTRIISWTLLLCVASYAGVTIGAALGRAGSYPTTWQIAACDVGQGDAVLVRSQQFVVLIDTGPEPKALASCLKELGIARIQLLILSHYDLDHVGGTSAVLGIVDRALVGPASDPSDTKLRKSLERSGATVSEVVRGERGRIGELGWEVLWPPVRLGTVKPGNDSSLAVRFEGVGQCLQGCLSALFLGDLGEEAQSRMFQVAHPAPVDVVKVAHHGSADQSAKLYERVSARVGLVSVGVRNSYGHPTSQLLNILASTGTKVARTDWDGLILVSPTPDHKIEVWRQHSPPSDSGRH